MQLLHERVCDALAARLGGDSDTRDRPHLNFQTTEKTSRSEQEGMREDFARAFSDDQIGEPTANIVREVGASLGQPARIGKCARVNGHQALEIGRASGAKRELR